MCNFIFVWVALVRVVAGYFEIKVLIVWGHSDINTIYYKWIFLKKSKLEPAIIWKRVTCQRITSKNTRTRWVDTWARDKVRWYWSLFWSADTLSIDHNIDLQTDFSWATKLARNCESKHWSPLWVRTDGRSFWRSVYGHVITKFSGTGRFTYSCCSANNECWSPRRAFKQLTLDKVPAVSFVLLARPESPSCSLSNACQAGYRSFEEKRWL